MKITFILTFIIGISSSLKKNEICKNIQQECKGRYNSLNHYVIDCNQVKCHGNHPFKCNQFYCTKNAKSCIDFYNFNRPSASMLKLPQRKKTHLLYANIIKACDSKKYNLNHENICLIGKNCSLVEKAVKYSRGHTISSIKKIACPCKGKYAYHCGNNYCTSNNIVCKNLNKKNKNLKTNFPKCLNDNQTIQTFIFE
jgi:hypothetical protein